MNDDLSEHRLIKSTCGIIHPVRATRVKRVLALLQLCTPWPSQRSAAAEAPGSIAVPAPDALTPEEQGRAAARFERELADAAYYPPFDLVDVTALNAKVRIRRRRCMTGDRG